jgi:hypothetical protein
MIKCFNELIRRVMEAHIDSIVVGTGQSEGLVADLRLAFERSKAKGIKLNLKKWDRKGKTQDAYPSLSKYFSCVLLSSHYSNVRGCTNIFHVLSAGLTQGLDKAKVNINKLGHPSERPYPK